MIIGKPMSLFNRYRNERVVLKVFERVMTPNEIVILGEG